MANKEQWKRLFPSSSHRVRGFAEREAWNQWRIGHPDVAIDLRDIGRDEFIFGYEDGAPVPAQLAGLNLSNANLASADLSEADLSVADLTHARLGYAILSGTVLRNAQLINADLYCANLTNADLSGADLQGANLYDADLTNANLNGADLSRANLSGAELSGANLSHARLVYARLGVAGLYNADLSEADLSGADLNWITLYKARLTNARLCSAKLDRAMIDDANLTGADLTGADMCSGEIRRIDEFTRHHTSYWTSMGITLLQQVGVPHSEPVWPEIAPDIWANLQQEASNPTTRPHRLAELATHWPGYRVRHLIASNPNTPQTTLIALALSHPRAFLTNPVLPLLFISDPRWLHAAVAREILRQLRQSEEWPALATQYGSLIALIVQCAKGD